MTNHCRRVVRGPWPTCCTVHVQKHEITDWGSVSLPRRVLPLPSLLSTFSPDAKFLPGATLSLNAASAPDGMFSCVSTSLTAGAALDAAKAPLREAPGSKGMRHSIIHMEFHATSRPLSRVLPGYHTRARASIDANMHGFMHAVMAFPLAAWP